MSESLDLTPFQIPGIRTLLGGSWDLVTKVIIALIGVIRNYTYSYPSY